MSEEEDIRGIIEARLKKAQEALIRDTDYIRFSDGTGQMGPLDDKPSAKNLERLTFADDTHTGCGYYPIIFNAGFKKQCGYHDEAYLQGSDAQKWLTRKEVDQALLRDLKQASKGNFFKYALAHVMYVAVRLVGGVFWEGHK